MSEPLLFANPQFHEGVNVTVRNGLKWDMLIDQLPKELYVYDTNDKSYGKAKVVGKLVIPFNDIPRGVLLLEHDRFCITPDNLKVAMRHCYGPDWDENGIATILFFEHISEDD